MELREFALGILGSILASYLYEELKSYLNKNNEDNSSYELV